MWTHKLIHERHDDTKKSLFTILITILIMDWKIKKLTRKSSFYRHWYLFLKTTLYKVHWLRRLFETVKITNTFFTLNIRHSKFQWVISWYHLLLGHNYFLTDNSILLKAKERTVCWWVNCAFNEYRCLHDVWSACNSGSIWRRMQLVWCWIVFLPK